jgi:hypothetical protein
VGSSSGPATPPESSFIHLARWPETRKSRKAGYTTPF